MPDFRVEGQRHTRCRSATYSRRRTGGRVGPDVRAHRRRAEPAVRSRAHRRRRCRRAESTLDVAWLHIGGVGAVEDALQDRRRQSQVRLRIGRGDVAERHHGTRVRPAWRTVRERPLSARLGRGRGSAPETGRRPKPGAGPNRAAAARPYGRVILTSSTAASTRLNGARSAAWKTIRTCWPAHGAMEIFALAQAGASLSAAPSS